MSDCVFCRIVEGEIPAKVAARTDEAVAIHDLNPQAPIHLLIVPVRHLAAVRDVSGDEGALMLGRLMQFAAGLNLYYAVSNVATLPQQYWITKERKKAVARGPQRLAERK